MQHYHSTSITGIHFFLIFAQNIDCGYALEPPRGQAKKREEMYTPVNPFYYIKVGCKGV